MSDVCPHCGADLKGEPIPEVDRKTFGWATHFDRRIGVYDTGQDLTIAWKCPDCEKEWPR
jgi:hypothetical protein